MSTRDRKRRDTAARKVLARDMTPSAIVDWERRQGIHVFTDRDEKRTRPEAITRPLRALLAATADAPTALVSLSTSIDGITAIVAGPTADHPIEVLQWRPTLGETPWLSRYAEADQRREERLQTLIRQGYTELFAPVMHALVSRDVRRVLLSVPGPLARVPFEALFDGTAHVADRVDVLYVPSFTVAADLVQPASRRMAKRCLLVGYGGDDLPAGIAEVESLRRIWGDRITVLAGAECTKARVLQELTGNYDVVHFTCHGTYDEQRPLASALHLVPDSADDAHSVTAWDLVDRVRFANAPVVSMSACSSGMMALTESNTCHGLAGALLRAGARSIIGSRWDVYDDLAAELMSETYRLVVETKATVPACLHDVQRRMRSTRGVEDWAAFGCLGLP